MPTDTQAISLPPYPHIKSSGKQYSQLILLLSYSPSPWHSFHPSPWAISQRTPSLQLLMAQGTSASPRVVPGVQGGQIRLSPPPSVLCPGPPAGMCPRSEKGGGILPGHASHHVGQQGLKKKRGIPGFSKMMDF